MTEIKRGDVYYVFLRENNCSIESGRRPVVIISSNHSNEKNDFVVVCPMTTKLKKHSCNVDVDWTANGSKTQVLCNQIITMAKSAMKNRRGCVSDSDLDRIFKGIKLSFDDRSDNAGKC